MMTKMTSLFVASSLAGILAIVGTVTFRLTKSGMATEYYREQLQQVVGQYHDLRQQYNRAVEKTAVTELLVEGGKLSVIVRTAEGVVECYDTPYNPRNEIYIDFVVKDNRLWIRRVYDSTVPAEKGMVINPRLGRLDWTDPTLSHGQAIYRGGLTDGRWIVTTTGSGAMRLSKLDGDVPITLSPPPLIEDFETIDRELDARAREIGPTTVFRRLLSGG